MKSLVSRLTLVITLVGSIPTLFALLPAVVPRGSWSGVGLMLVIGWSLLAVGLIGVIAWMVARSLLRPIVDVTTAINPFNAGSRGRGTEEGESDSAPVEIKLLRAAIFGREVSRRRETAERATYVSTLIHDMKTPLIAVDRSLGVADGELDVEARRRWIAAARDEVKRLLALVQDVVDAERLASGTLATTVDDVDLASVCHAVVQRLSPVRDDVTIEFSSLGAVRHTGDAVLLERAIENIVVNAVRHARSTVLVEVTPGLVRVADDGTGVPLDLEGLEPSRSGFGADSVPAVVSPRRPGLGLFIAQRILEAHGGRLVLEASGPGGATMLLYVGAPRRAGLDS